MTKPWTNLAKVVYKRTYSRQDNGVAENWNDTIDRAVAGNIRGHSVPESEVKALLKFGKQRKAIPAGRGLWFSGAPAHEKIGGKALCNCWFLTAEDWTNFVVGQDLSMLGGGVGLSVEHRYVSKLPKVKKDVVIEHKNTKDADFIIPDSREGWCQLTYRVLESFFETGKSFSYSTICVRGAGEKINGFGGVSSGPIPIVKFVQNVSKLLSARESRSIRPIDAADLLCAVGEMVVSGNVRRSAVIIIGDPWDKELLKAKRWDLGDIPSYRSNANFSVVCSDVDDLHPLFWKSYDVGEPFGIVNLKNIQKYGRMGELKKDTAIGTNPCAEATLESHEPCNLQEIPLMNIYSEDEFVEVARLMHRWGKRVTMEDYGNKRIESVVKRNRRVGTGITGCLGSSLFNPKSLTRVYTAIDDENRRYSSTLGIPESIRTTVVKPSGTVSKVLDQAGYEGIHAAFSRYMIQRIRFASNDPLVPVLKAAGHNVERQVRLDGSLDATTVVVDFYLETPHGVPVADEDWTTWKQLDVLKMAQKYWADQAVSVTIYYKREEIPELKTWMADNLQYLKTISFLCHNDHGFKQAPKEAITAKQYDQLASKIKPIDIEQITTGDLESQECQSGLCPVK